MFTKFIISDEFALNAEYCFGIISAWNIPLMWTVEEYLNHPDENFLLYQLYLVYDKFKGNYHFNIYF